MLSIVLLKKIILSHRKLPSKSPFKILYGLEWVGGFSETGNHPPTLIQKLFGFVNPCRILNDPYLVIHLMIARQTITTMQLNEQIHSKKATFLHNISQTKCFSRNSTTLQDYFALSLLIYISRSPCIYFIDHGL